MSEFNIPHLSFISSIKKELKKPLPGRKYQYQMAPDDRDLRYSKNPKRSLPKKAGVMILLFPFSGQVSLVFIKRAVYSGSHSGQISFPGGTMTSKDHNLFQTAVRETREELGIELSNILNLGALTPLYIAVSNFMVFPFVGFIKETPVFKVQASEVQFAFMENLNTLREKKIRGYFEVDFPNLSFTAPYYLVKEQKIWGATAMILSEFLEIIQRADINSKQ